MEIKNKNNVICPFCDEPIMAESIKLWKCKNCGQDLKINFTKKGGHIYIELPDVVFGKFLPKIKWK